MVLQYCKSSKSWVGGPKKVKNMMTYYLNGPKRNDLEKRSNRKKGKKSRKKTPNLMESREIEGIVIKL